MTTARLKAPLEKNVQASVVKALRLYGCIVHSLSQYRPSHVSLGLPDLYFQDPKRRRRGFVEVKRPGGKLTMIQRAWHDAERAAGGEVYVVTSGAEMLAILEGAS